MIRTVLFGVVLQLCLLVTTAAPTFSTTTSPYEPIFHVRPPSNWVGPPSAAYRDPSTSILHLYMQHNPSATTATSIAWFHVTSTDYVHWSHVTPATALSTGASYDSAAVLSGVFMRSNRGAPVVLYTCTNSSGAQQQCLAGAGTDSTGAADFATLVKSANNPVLVPGDVPRLVDASYFRDPTEWWADPVTPNRWLVAFAGGVADASGARAKVLVFATTDPTFQSNYRYSHSLYADNLTARLGTFEHPSFFTTVAGGERYLKLSLLELQRDVVLYGSYAANASNTTQYIFTPSSSRWPTVVDYGAFYGATTYWDAVLNTRRVWGWIREELTPSQVAANGWSGLQTIRNVVYDATERRLRFPPISELHALRTTQLVTRRLVSITEAAPVVIYAGGSAVPRYQEIVANFYVPSTLFDGTQYFAADPPEFGVHLRVSPDATHYVAVSLRMPATNATTTRGYRQPGTPIRQLAVGEDGSDAATRCRSACAAFTLCEAWNIRMSVSGFTCELLETALPLEVDCSARTSRPNVPLLVVNRTVSGSAGSLGTQSGRAPLTNAHAGYVRLHIFIDDSVIEVYKDEGTEVLSSRVYLAAEDHFTGLSLFARNLQGQADMLADVTAYGMSSLWSSDTSSSSSE